MDNNIEKIADYFREGEKAKCMATGVEIEHFIIGEDGNSMDYAQVVEVMEKLTEEKDVLFIEDGHLLGFYNDDYSITLEPASQMEISIAPKERIEEIKEIYERFREKADKILAARGYRFETTGYHPYQKAEELELIPKKRYEYMNRYFEQSGTMGKNMMRATASVQVSIDYKNEEDFVEKYRLACILSPVFYLLTSNSPVFEGKKAENKMVRALVWMNTDKARCGIFPGTFSEDFGYVKYAEYLYENEPILIKDENGKTISTEHKKLSEIYAGKEMTKSEIEYAISMFFPDVRLKNYIEIRMADSMELDKVLEYTALVKNIFYRKEIRKQLTAFFGKVTEEEIERAKLSLMEKGWDGEVYGKPVRSIVEKITELYKRYGSGEEQQYVHCGKLLENEAEKMTENYEKSLEEINNEYQSLIKEDRKEDYLSAQDAFQYIQNSTAKYHGRCVRTLYIPKIFRETDIRIFEKAVTDLYGIFDKVMKAYREDAEYRALFGFDKKLEELILREKTYSSNIPIARIDIFYNEETGSFKFCEFNTDGSSAMNEDRELNNAIRLTKAYQQFAKKYEIHTFELFDTWVEEFLSIYKEFAANTGHIGAGENGQPQVAIVDFMENATEQEFKIFKARFEARGIKAELCEIRDLQYREGKLYTGDGMVVDAVYRRAVTSDIMKHYEEVKDFLQSVTENAVCLAGEFRTQIAHNKILFKILHDEKTKALLTAEEQEYVKAHVPVTVKLENGKFDYDDVIKNKNNWIIKPEDSYGSQRVFAGVEYEDTEWKEKVDEAIGKDYLLQEFCLPYETKNLDLMQKEDAEYRNYSNLTGMFVYNGRFKGIYSRISQSEIISTQYSEMALPTIWVN